MSIYGLLDFVRLRLLVRTGNTLDRQLHEKAFAASLLLPLRAGHEGSRVQPIRDLDQIRAFVSGTGPTAFFDLPWMPFYLIIIYMLHPSLGLLATVGAALSVLLTLVAEGFARASSRRATEAAISRTAYAEAGRRNAEVIRAMGLSSRFGRLWSEQSLRFLKDQRRVSDVVGGTGALSRALRMMLQSLMLGLGAYLVISGEASAGVIIASSIMLSRALAPVDIAIANWRGFMSARQSYAQLSKTLATFAVRSQPMALPRPQQTLSVEGLTVAAPGQQKPLIQNVTFALEAGAGLGVIGPSASGKSTLVRALVGAWPALRGTVRLDQAALEQWDVEALGRDIGYLPQDIELFEGTVADNICRFDPERRSEGHPRGSTGGGRRTHDPAPAGRLPDTRRRRRCSTLGRAAATGRAGARALRRSVPGGARRAQLQSRRRRRRVSDDRHPGRPSARRHRHRGRPPPLRTRQSRPGPGDGGRHGAGVRPEGRSAGQRDPALRRRLQQPAAHAAAPQSSTVVSLLRSKVIPMSSVSEKRADSGEGIRANILFGLAVSTLLVGGVGAWAATTSLAGAVIASGNVVVESNSKKVQHQTGGIVGEILVEEGDRVSAGDVIVRLDETTARANLQIVTQQYERTVARQARLQAELSGLPVIKFPDSLAKRAGDPDIDVLIAGERALFESRTKALAA